MLLLVVDTNLLLNDLGVVGEGNRYDGVLLGELSAFDIGHGCRVHSSGGEGEGEKQINNRPVRRKLLHVLNTHRS
jgi:hypothetical protein